MLLAALVYAAVGLVLSLAIGTHLIMFVSPNATEVLLGWMITPARLFPWSEARARRNPLE